MDIFQFLLMVIIIVTGGGWCLDWVFSGSMYPMYANSAKSDTEYREFTITCHMCGEQGIFSVPIGAESKEVKCKRCGSFLSEKE